MVLDERRNMTTEHFNAFQEKFRVSELLVQDYEYWNWSIRPTQGTLGAGIISLSRPAGAWSEISVAENSELIQVIRDIEARCSEVFKYDRINYLMLMMVDVHVHFHVFPRYSSLREFADIQWNDASWPKPPELATGVTDSDKLLAIKTQLQK